ncbi:pre-rRNA processing protein FTSJ3-like protein, partial [Dinothrombium tinctorium]
KEIFKEMCDDDEDLELMLKDGKDETKREKRTKKYVSSEDESEEEKEKDAPKSEKDVLLSEKCREDIKLDAEGLALAELMIRSQKAKRELIDNSWNRYVRGDEDNAPSWFRKDEEKYNKRPLPVSTEVVEEYKNKMRAINARPIKKVAEAKARKKKRALRKLEKAKKKAESLTDAPDMSEKEKAAHLRSIYKKYLKTNEKKVTYVVAKKGLANRRPNGVKGKYKMVDPRMKKDKRAKKGDRADRGDRKSNRK